MNLQKISRDKLPYELREPLRQLIYQVKYASPVAFLNREGYLPPAGTGNHYYEYDVGTDRYGLRGRFRLVGLFAANNSLIALYFTSAHYQGQWTEIMW